MEENQEVCNRTLVVTTAATQVVAVSTPIPAAKPKTLKIADASAVSTRRRKGVVIRDPEEELHTDTPAETPTVKDKGKGILIEDPKPMKKKDQVEMDAVYVKKLQEELNKEHEEAYKQIDWNTAFDHVQSKETQYIKRYHGFKKKPQSESEARKNMISDLKNTKGYKMELFKGKTYDQILPIFQARFDANMKFLFKTREEMEKEDEDIIKSINETPAQKAAKRRKLSEEAQEADDLKKRLEIVQDEDDDVFVKAVPLAQKVPIVDYQVVVIDNKPKNQKSVHGLALVKRWKLLTSCGVHAIILSTVQLFLFVERRYPLSRFTLEQLVNVARLQVEEEKIQPMIDNMVWVLVDLPPGCKTVRSKWIFKRKTDIDGIVHTYKARLVSKGYTQFYEVDYEETFSPIADIRAIRILISIAAFYDYEIWKMDVKTAFLNGYLDEYIYMVQAEGFVDSNHPRKVCKLQRSIYSLKQASRSWNKRFDEDIKKFGFAQNLDEPCVYQKASGSNVTFLILYVDDIIIIGNHILSLQSVKDYIGKCFAMKDLGEASFILGIKIYRDMSKRLIGLG
uniref:Retrotransposon protein, putative, Ty1-copia subclass n=1 Tax=Tanacetum cinerariifolium TaxID=118510 RepID=A0A6L2MFE4_TANCI|nr:retrotransposon protein, putative, Ty1-copia subclass [Tanacetum cinerariifolium]